MSADPINKKNFKQSLESIKALPYSQRMSSETYMNFCRKWFALTVLKTYIRVYL